MTITQIKQMLTNKLATLDAAKQAAFDAGELESFTVYEAQIAETQETLNKMANL